MHTALPHRSLAFLALALAPTLLAASCDGALSIGGEKDQAGAAGEGATDADPVDGKGGTSTTGGTDGKGGSDAKGGSGGKGGTSAVDAGAGKDGMPPKEDGGPADGDPEKDGGTPGYEFGCADGTMELAKEQLCNGKPDCADGSDESDCPTPDGFVCKGTDPVFTIAADMVCNGNVECPSGDDEADCHLPIEEFRCDNGEKLLLKPDGICNGSAECADGSDEKNCPVPSDELFFCVNGSKIDVEQVCDLFDDCADLSDEDACDQPEHANCPAGVDSANAYDPKLDCLKAAVRIGCAELVHPDRSVPKEWGITRCAKRVHDGTVFLLPEPRHRGYWAECTAREAVAAESAGFCDEE